MPCFVCDNCECVDNTATGHYWSRQRDIYDWSKILDRKGMKLCSECAPPYFKDGTKTGLGAWHDKFPKEHWSVHFKEKPLGTF